MPNQRTEMLFMERMRLALNNAAKDLPERAQKLVLAHAAYESGWGATRAFYVGNNPFNMTRLPTEQGGVIIAGDLEYLPEGGVKKITQRFAAYPTLEVGIAEYLKFIDRKRYRPALQFLIDGKVEEFITTLHKGGYFTLPLPRYLSTFKLVLAKVESAWASALGQA